jgi:hypothetical protein
MDGGGLLEASPPPPWAYAAVGAPRKKTSMQILRKVVFALDMETS